ncbi:hypothetical protein GCM10022202_28020 [Microbacterium marinilacus]|uniref:Uncharacterized protein n=1 Tax=Microbacterium marinilacus TaxID=415209 RepID=A0ABP7BLR9_9MICO
MGRTLTDKCLGSVEIDIRRRLRRDLTLKARPFARREQSHKRSSDRVEDPTTLAYSKWMGRELGALPQLVTLHESRAFDE